MRGAAEEGMTYRYATMRIVVTLGPCIASIAAIGFVTLLLPYLELLRPQSIHGSVWAFLFVETIFVASMVIAIATFRFYHRRVRPITISSTVIASSGFLGLGTKTIAWSEIEGVDRKRLFDRIYMQNRFFFEVRGKKFIIYFDDSIRGIRELLDTLNLYIGEYKIPVKAIDRGSDTLKNIGETVLDPLEKRALLQSGRVSKVITF